MKLETSNRRMLATWAAVAGALSTAARQQAKEAARYPASAGPAAIMLAEAAAYAFHQATGDGDWAAREELFQPAKEVKP
nr:hypothetical protein [Brevundimonas naejangsanensis]